MAEDPKPKAETNEEKAVREAEEKRLNEAESRIKGWVTSAVQEHFQKNPPKESKDSSPQPVGKRSILDTILGR